MDRQEINRRFRTLADHPDDPLRLVRVWMEEAGLRTHVDAAGSVRGVYGEGPRLLIGSELDSPGIVVAIALAGQRPPCSVEVATLPFAGSFSPEVRGYLELCSDPGLEQPLGIVESIAGESRWDLRFAGDAGRDPLFCAAEWIGLVEHLARTTPGLTAAISHIKSESAALHATLDVCHAMDETRGRALNVLLDGAEHIATQRGLTVEGNPRVDQPAAALYFDWLARAVESAAYPVYRVASHPIPGVAALAQKLPVSVLMIRDTDAALTVVAELLRTWTPA